MNGDENVVNILFMRLIGLLSKHRELMVYLLVGVWNTLFGIGLYSLAYYCFGKNMHYLLLAVPVNVLAITNAFLCYKLFVFRTKGNWLREYFRCYVVYGGGSLLGMFLLWLLKEKLCIHPVVANAIATILVIIASYIGHKYFSFRKA